MLTFVKTKLEVRSPAFDHNGYIPLTYTCDGINISPALIIEKIPGEAKSLAIIVDDPDAPGGTFTHWLIWNISPQEGIEENSAPGIQGKNSKRQNKFSGPCPPSGTHHYHFKIYALDKIFDLPEGAERIDLEKEMEGHVVAMGELVGLYKSTMD
jgi:Raf kinase inhibitor-like YbhB/YbcL family protein